MNTLIDTNIFIGALVVGDQHYQVATRLLSDLQTQQALVAVPVLAELFYAVKKYTGYRQAIQAIRIVRLSFKMEPLLPQDFARMEEIMTQYADARFDYTDVAIMAIAERLDIAQIYTFDRRDFSIVRPHHRSAFELLP